MAKVVIETSDKYTYNLRNWPQVGLVGAVLGVLAVALGWLLERYVVDLLLCRGDSLESCAQSGLLAGNIAGIVLAVLGAVLLIRLHVYRALGIAVAALATLWGVGSLMVGLPTAEVFAWTAGLYALSYVLFAQLFRIRSIFIAVIAAMVVLIVFRWVAFL